MRELRFFNKGGVAWNQGIPKNDPPAAAGMKLATGMGSEIPPRVSEGGR